MAIVERLEWGKWVTPRLLRERPIYNWYVYPHSYDKDLVLALLQEMQVQPGEWVWDPFVGAGTTLLACREYGCSGVGTDILPLSVLVSQAKSLDYDRRGLSEYLEGFSYVAPPGTVDRFAPIPVVRQALPSARRLQISHLHNQIQGLPRPSRLFFQVALLRTVEDLGFAEKNGGWLRINPDRDIRGKFFKAVFRQHAVAMLGDIESSRQARAPRQSLQIRLADARTAATGHQISACITSPPYLNRHDYTRVFALELALLAVRTPSALIALRKKTLRSHVEARRPSRIQPPQIVLPRAVQGIVSEVEEAGPNDIRVPRMIAGYFEDMALTMVNISGQLKPGGRVAFVIGNTRHAGIMIPVDELLAEIAPLAGLDTEQIIVTRWRGNSAQQMGDYGRSPARESVVILKKPTE